jgi:3-oxoacyl-[acyl-carrier-protein] synthase-3
MNEKVYIKSSGSYLPNNKVTNFDLPKSLETSDEWIVQRTGIKQRFIANENEDVVTMGAKSAEKALKNGKINPEKIDMIIVATTTPNKIFPSCGVQIQSILGCKNACAYDIQAVCSGFLYGYYIAAQILKSDKNIKNILLIGAEKLSSILDWNDRSTCVLFGDGAGAILLSKRDGDGFIDGILKSDGDLSDVLYANKNNFLKMDGRKVFINATIKLEKVILDLCSRNNININDIQYFLIHQANVRILDYLAERLKVNKNKFLITVDIHANTSAASIPLLIDYYKDLFKENDLILMAGVGAGMTWGACLLNW